MPHIRLFTIQFALCLLALVLFGVGFTGAPTLVVPVLIHLGTLVSAGYAARPNRTIQSQYATFTLTTIYTLTWIVYALANVGPNMGPVYAGFFFNVAQLVATFAITRQFRREVEEENQLEPIHPAPPL